MIRRATSADVPAIAALYHAVWHETHDAVMPAAECRHRGLLFFLDRMTALCSTTLVHEEGGVIAGFVAWKGHFLGQLFVAEAYRGTAIAAALLVAAEAAMRAEGTREAELHCVVGNARARRFYERQGWREVEVLGLPALSDGGTVDVPFWRMTKRLAP